MKVLAVFVGNRQKCLSVTGTHRQCFAIGVEELANETQIIISKAHVFNQQLKAGHLHPKLLVPAIVRP